MSLPGQRFIFDTLLLAMVPEAERQQLSGAAAAAAASPAPRRSAPTALSGTAPRRAVRGAARGPMRISTRVIAERLAAGGPRVVYPPSARPQQAVLLPSARSSPALIRPPSPAPPPTIRLPSVRPPPAIGPPSSSPLPSVGPLPAFRTPSARHCPPSRVRALTVFWWTFFGLLETRWRVAEARCDEFDVVLDIGRQYRPNDQVFKTFSINWLSKRIGVSIEKINISTNATSKCKLESFQEDYEIRESVERKKERKEEKKKKKRKKKKAISTIPYLLVENKQQIYEQKSRFPLPDILGESAPGQAGLTCWEKAFMWSSTARTSGMTSLPPVVMGVVPRWRRATCSTARPSVKLMGAPLNMASRRASTCRARACETVERFASSTTHQLRGKGPREHFHYLNK
ncbi:Protein of unknown function [Gryllus bimaculatus]|nr:Protein of unknown function [Gryllus bimaculatus]